MWSRALLVSTLVVSGCAGTGPTGEDGAVGSVVSAPGPLPQGTATPSSAEGAGSAVFIDRRTHSNDDPTPPDTVTMDVGRPAGRSADGSSTSNAEAGSPPRHIEIPALEVEAEIIDLGLLADGSLETPTDFAEAGWWAGGAAAGESGPTVIVGHVDSFEGPAVFFRLSELSPGDHVVVTDAHGTSHRFRVTEVELYDKTDFPTERVYGDTDQPTLRLVTCGGAFDSRDRSYEANWVVFADSA